MTTLRPAESTDMHMVFQWRNRWDIIQNSTLEREVGWNEHTTWFTNCLAASSQEMLIIEHQHEPIGQLRFDQQTGHVCSVSIYLLPEWQGRGHGVRALQRGCAAIASTWKMPILAFVREGNVNSQKAFSRAGFVFSDIESKPNHITLEYAP